MPGERVLVVEDDAINLKLIVYLLKVHNYVVTVATNGEAALEAIRRHLPDVVLMDVQLPGVDGLEVVRRLRADIASRELLIIAVTAYAMNGDKEKALVAGCDDYIIKPIDTRTLPAVIAKLLERR
jgi:two-component system cell cycle response regulator DivK